MSQDVITKALGGGGGGLTFVEEQTFTFTSDATLSSGSQTKQVYIYKDNNEKYYLIFPQASFSFTAPNTNDYIQIKSSQINGYTFADTGLIYFPLNIIDVSTSSKTNQNNHITTTIHVAYGKKSFTTLYIWAWITTTLMTAGGPIICELIKDEIN